MAQIIRYRQKGPPEVRAAPYQILCLSGGGYRGLFTAVILEDLETRAGKPLRECFDLIAGTSIGGILACGIAAGVPAVTIRQEFEKLGTAVFDRHLSVFGRRLFPVPRIGLLTARYSRNGLDAAIRGVLGDLANEKLVNIKKPLLVPAVSATSGTTILFESGPVAGSNASVTLRDVALATSAAPTYFPEHAIGPNSLIDGGLVANAPDAVAVIKAMSTNGRHADEIRLLSVGTAGEATGEIFRPGRASGAIRWMVRRKLFGLTIAAQQALATQLVHELLGSHNIRIDMRPDPARGQAIALDQANVPASDTLKGLASEALADVTQRSGADLSAMLRHTAAQ
jgi:predicted acylesterase/phospholipase RssA